MTETSSSITQSASPHRSRAKKRSDPFDHIPQLSHIKSSEDKQNDEQHEHEDDLPDTLFNKVVIGPLMFTSFLVSLLLVDRRDRAWRMRQHPAASLWARLSNWIDPEPYQDPNDSTWRKDEGAANTRNPAVDGNPGHKPQKARQPWFRQKKHRKMAKYEFEDAFALRDSVAAWILGAGLLVVGGTAYVIKSLFGWRFW